MQGVATAAIVSLFALGSYTYSFVSPTPKIVSPLPQTKEIPTPTPTIIPTPTPSPTPLPTPIPTPTIVPTPTSTPIILTATEFDGLFTKYSGEYSIDRSLLWKIAVCESGLRVQAVNGPYAGIYQFSQSTWQSTRAAMNMDPNPELRFNPEEAIRTAAFKISRGGAGAWPHCSK